MAPSNASNGHSLVGTRITSSDSPDYNKSAISPNIPKERLASISRHMAPPSATVFPADTVPQAPEDPLFGLMAAYRKDEFEKKVDLGIGAYRDDNAKPWVLPVVKQVGQGHPFRASKQPLPLDCCADTAACYVRRTSFYDRIPTSITNTFP